MNRDVSTLAQGRLQQAEDALKAADALLKERLWRKNCWNYEGLPPQAGRCVEKERRIVEKDLDFSRDCVMVKTMKTLSINIPSIGGTVL